MTDYEILYAAEQEVCGSAFPEFVQVLTALPAGCRVLDLGCGQGRDALIAARAGHLVVGVDLSPAGVGQLVQQAEAENLRVTGVVADIAFFEPDSAFDVVVIDRVLHMLTNDDVRRAVLGRMVRCIPPGGHLLIADTPKTLPMIQAFMMAQGDAWTATLARKGFLFWRHAESLPIAPAPSKGK